MNLESIKRLLSQGVRITFEQSLRDVQAPAHMRGPWSSRWFGVLGAFVEMIWQGGQHASDVDIPDTCPADALDLVGAGENIERLVEEPDGTYRDRLRNPFATWEASARDSGIEAQLGAYRPGTWTAYDIAAGWDPGDMGDWSFPFMDQAWDRFWVVGDQPHPWTPLLASEDLIASEDLVAGVDGMTQLEYRNLRRLVLKWRSGHSSPVSFYIIFSGALASLSTAAVDALIAAEDAVELPITRPWASDDLIADDNVFAGYYIEPV